MIVSLQTPSVSNLKVFVKTNVVTPSSLRVPYSVTVYCLSP